MYKTILVPIDMAHVVEGKSTIDIALEQVDEDGKIILLNVVEEIPNWAAVELPSDLIDKSIFDPVVSAGQSFESSTAWSRLFALTIE